MFVLSDHAGPISSIAFSPDGRLLAEAARRGMIRVWDLATKLVAWRFSPAIGHGRLEFSSNGKYLAVTSGVIAVLEIDSGDIRRLRDRSGLFFQSCFSPDCRNLIGVGHVFRRYEVGSWKRLKGLGGAQGYFQPAAAWSPNGKQLAISFATELRNGSTYRPAHAIQFWNAATWKKTAEVFWQGRAGVRLAYSPDGKQIAAACGPVLRVWDVHTLRLVVDRSVGSRHFLGIAWSPDGRSLLTVSQDRAARQWSTADWTANTVYDWKIGPLADTAFAPDGLTAAVASRNGKIAIFDVDA